MTVILSKKLLHIWYWHIGAVTTDWKNIPIMEIYFRVAKVIECNCWRYYAELDINIDLDIDITVAAIVLQY